MKHARSMDRPSFFLFVRAVLPESPRKPGPERAREVGGRISQRLLQSAFSLCRMAVAV